jgi:hypothetical protein
LLALLAGLCAAAAALAAAWIRAPEASSAVVPSENITTIACVERRPRSGRIALRVVDAVDSTLKGRTARAASADASGGQTTGVAAMPSRHPNQSTTVNGVWLGTRVYLVAARAAHTVERYMGQRVVVSGILEPYAISGTGAVATVQSARGVRLRELRPLEVRPAAGVCSPPRRR